MGTSGCVCVCVCVCVGGWSLVPAMPRLLQQLLQLVLVPLSKGPEPAQAAALVALRTFSSMSAHTGRQLKQSVNVRHRRML